MVAIKVTGTGNSPLNGIKVTLDTGQSAVTDTTGVASFTNVTLGKHTVKAVINGKTNSQIIDVKGVSSTKVQQFAVQASQNKTSNTKTILIVFGVIITLLAVGFVLWKQFGSRFRPLKSAGTGGTPGIILGGGSQPTVTPDNDSRNQIPMATPTSIGSVFSPADGANQVNTPPPSNGIPAKDVDHDQV
jgi:hypothetical protein